MTGAALALVLASAAVHALWNWHVADADDTHATTALALLAGAVLFAPLAIVTWHVEAAALPYLAGSVVFELAFLVLLATAYARADLTFVYPVARGSAPVVVLVVSVAFLGTALADGGARRRRARPRAGESGAARRGGGRGRGRRGDRAELTRRDGDRGRRRLVR